MFRTHFSSIGYLLTEPQQGNQCMGGQSVPNVPSPNPGSCTDLCADGSSCEFPRAFVKLQRSTREFLKLGGGTYSIDLYQNTSWFFEFLSPNRKLILIYVKLRRLHVVLPALLQLTVPDVRFFPRHHHIDLC